MRESQRRFTRTHRLEGRVSASVSSRVAPSERRVCLPLQMGGKVGILDADVHGPSLPTMISPDPRVMIMDPATKVEWTPVDCFTFAFAAVRFTVRFQPAASGNTPDMVFKVCDCSCPKKRQPLSRPHGPHAGDSPQQLAAIRAADQLGSLCCLTPA